MTEDYPIDCVGIICFRGEEVLLIKRGTPPRKGEWSIPGGRIEAGESEASAALRELYEETSVTATIHSKIATIPAKFEGFNYILHDYVAIWQDGTPKAGDDASEAIFVTMEDISMKEMWSKTKEVIHLAHESVSKAE
ncbi:8-oxo-dGTP diphosphatase [Litorimonas taeanensis]|uniref:8-oxo-dGTP diphosphatase n=1 Tax=Litorimonas taeanensis TaxID=568099 RepID=A0A420WIS7_9PROT|nr:NUDIX hydrolase [Litorimonas taeanensis]RKQ70839.1 8-oxo-dGTP diphosphatase [Litorimonas taeanensis]